MNDENIRDLVRIRYDMEFIHTPSEFFSREDLSTIQGMERVRSASDYDDFYVTNKAECEEQVAKAGALLNKVHDYLQEGGFLS